MLPAEPYMYVQSRMQVEVWSPEPGTVATWTGWLLSRTSNRTRQPELASGYVDGQTPCVVTLGVWPEMPRTEPLVGTCSFSNSTSTVTVPVSCGSPGVEMS